MHGVCLNHGRRWWWVWAGRVFIVRFSFITAGPRLVLLRCWRLLAKKGCSGAGRLKKTADKKPLPGVTIVSK